MKVDSEVNIISAVQVNCIINLEGWDTYCRWLVGDNLYGQRDKDGKPIIYNVPNVIRFYPGKHQLHACLLNNEELKLCSPQRWWDALGRRNDILCYELGVLLDTPYSELTFVKRKEAFDLSWGNFDEKRLAINFGLSNLSWKECVDKLLSKDCGPAIKMENFRSSLTDVSLWLLKNFITRKLSIEEIDKVMNLKTGGIHGHFIKETVIDNFRQGYIFYSDQDRNKIVSLYEWLVKYSSFIAPKSGSVV